MLIYGLFDPISHQLRYIGKTNNLKTRLAKHKTEKSNNHKCAWFKSLAINNLYPYILELDCVADDEWSFWEDWYIQYFKSIGCNLTNIRPGGLPGPRFTQEMKNKMSHANKGKPKTAECKRKISEARKNNLEWNLNISRALKGKPSPLTLEQRKTMSIKCRKNRHTDETRLAISLSKLGKKRQEFSEEWRKNLSNAGRGKKRSDESRLKYSSVKKKLTQHQVFEILKKRKDENISAKALGKQYGVCDATIRNVIRGKFYETKEAYHV